MSLATWCPCASAHDKLVVQVDELLHGYYDFPGPAHEQEARTIAAYMAVSIF